MIVLLKNCFYHFSYLNKLSDAEKYLDQAEKIIAVTHGRGHPIFTGTLDPLIQEIQGPML